VERWALDQLRKSPDVDLVLMGHSHLPAWIEVEPGRFYLNTGDWIEHMTYAVLPADKSTPTIRRWPDHGLVMPERAQGEKHPLEPASHA
jgi:UDP-2,3-diacylglucosamine pyrophosphatase LpxH